MKKFKMVSLIQFVIIFLLSACNLPSSQQDTETISTGVKIRLSVATEYRAGPGQNYDLGGILNPGQEVEVVGRSPGDEYLLIRDPFNPTGFWWMKSEFPTLTGELANLPIFTSPPPPTLIGATNIVGGCPTPVGGGPTPVSCGTTVPVAGSGCPTPIGGGPTPVSCGTTVPVAGSGCPTPIGGGPTPVSCSGNGSTTGVTTPDNPTPVWVAPNLRRNPTPVDGGSGSEPTPVK